MSGVKRIQRIVIMALICSQQLAVAQESVESPATMPYELPVKITMPARPPAAGARIEKKSCVIVDFSGDFGWSGFPGLGGGRGLGDKILNLDLDGDGKKNDSIHHVGYSLTLPFNPAPSMYRLHDVHNAVFYGGGVGYFYNRGPRLSECCINMDWCDTVSFNGYATDEGTGLRIFATWMWKKEDFINRGDECAVSFDENSMMYVHITRYWKDYQEGRFVAQQGGQFYLSEHKFGGIPSTARSGAPNNAKVYSVCPAKTRWAKWNPKPPYHLEYEPSKLEFEDVKFTDVETVGWVSTRYKNDGPASCWLKWAGFDVHATVTRPWRPSEHVNMVKLPGSELYMSETEIDFRTWRKISSWSFKQVWAHMPTYVYDRKGDMGSMDIGDFEHGAKEPVTDITWTDAITWCNALSEYEGLKPCYYSDAEHTKIFRRSRDRLTPEGFSKYPKVYVDWTADGYRLPNVQEWMDAAKDIGSSADHAWTKANAEGRTHEVGTKRASASGLYDMIGNVWEYVWDAEGGEFDPAVQKRRSVLGGGFRYPENVAQSAGLAHGEKPGDGQYNIGFRVVRYIDKGTKPQGSSAPVRSGFDTKPIPAWIFHSGEVIAGSGGKLTIDMKKHMVSVPAGSFKRGKQKIETSISNFDLGRNEVSYALWMQVHNWASVNGYEFNYNGDMGSMRSQIGSFTHSPNEPVTLLNASDMMIWCNALSEITGRIPVYYADEGKTKPLKKSTCYRWAIGERDRESKDTKVDDYVHVKWSADGWRLPTDAESDYVFLGYRNRDGRISQPAKTSKDLWLWVNSGGKTQPVGTSIPNKLGVHDLLGNVHELFWAGGGDVEDRKDPHSDKFSPTAVGGSYYIQPKDNMHYQMLSTKGFGAHRAYSDIGFRLARSEAGVLEDVKDRTPKVVLEFDPKAVDPLQGQMYRANNRRSGHFKTTGLPRLTGVKWKFKTGKGVGASPVVVDGIVYIGSLDRNFYAIDAETGKERWRFTTKGEIISSAVVFKGKVYFVSNDSLLHALSIADGKEVWKKASSVSGGRDYDAGPSPTVVAGIVFCNGKAGFRGFDPDSGKVVWDAPGKGGGAGTYALAYHPFGLLVKGGGSGYPGAIALRIARGRGSVGSVAGDTFQLTAACDDEHVYVAAGSGAQKVAILSEVRRGKAGNVVFTYREEHWNNMHPYFSALGVDDTNMYVGNIDKHLYAINKDTGKLSWKFETGGAVRSGPSIGGKVVYVGSEDGCLYAIDVATGKEKWKFATGAKITHSSPWVGNGVVYIGSYDGFVYALR
jgi:eukaryotic-like serine/threonine-protein kinase